MKTNAMTLFNSGNALFQRTSTSDNTFTVIKRSFPSGMECFIGFKMPNYNHKALYTTVLRELKSIGISQYVSALITGVSPSYVSKLLRK